MNILNTIIDQLTENEVSLTTSLLKIKVLASKLKNQELLHWVNKELNGYEENDELPKYRAYDCYVKFDYFNGNTFFRDQVVPIHLVPNPERKKLKTFVFLGSIDVLEAYDNVEKDNLLKVELSSGLLSAFTQLFKENGNPFVQVTSIHQVVGINAAKQTISSIRNIALDLILKLIDELGEEIQMEDIIKKRKEANNTIQHFMKETVIHNHGNGNLINTGNDNLIEFNITKSDFNSVREALKMKDVEENDIEELEKIIGEEPDFEKKLYGPKVKEWFKKMTGKALDGTWNIGISAAAGFLTEVLNQYYGM